MRSKTIYLAALTTLLLGSGCDRQRIEQQNPPSLPPTCANNLRRIGQAFQHWAREHGGEYPFNVSTNAGGTRELSRTRANGFAANPIQHFRILTNEDELTTPLLLVCPQDSSKTAASTLADLAPANLTYELHTTTNASENHADEPLAVCPVHGNILYCDGTITDSNKHPMPLWHSGN